MAGASIVRINTCTTIFLIDDWSSPADLLIEANFCVRFPLNVSRSTSSYLEPDLSFSRDGALPFSGFLYRINPYTGTPVHCVCFSASIACILGLLTFAGPAATGAIFSVSVVGQYVANSIPISARCLGGQPFERGPFHLGILVRLPTQFLLQK